MNALVTGSCGFLGSHLCDALMTRGDTVIGIDNLSSNAINPRSHDELYSVKTFMQRNTHSPDVIFHCASPVGPVGVLRRAGSIASAIIRDTCILAAYCVARDIPLVFISSSEVYGADGPCAEHDPCVLRPQHPSPRLEYAAGKLAAEVAISVTPSLNYRIIRPFNIAGPRQHSKGGFVLPRFISQAQRGEPLTVYGDGSARRAFTHVHDVVNGILLILGRGTPGPAYNLGNPLNLTTIKHLAEEVIRITGSPSTISHVNPRDLWGPSFVEVGDKWPAHCRAFKLGWEPRHSLEDIIRACLQ